MREFAEPQAVPRAVLTEEGFRLKAERPAADLLQSANAFLHSLALRGLSPRTVRAYAMDLAVIFRWAEADLVELGQLDEAALLKFLAQQRAAGAAPRSINRRLSTCRLFFRFTTGSDVTVSRIIIPRGRSPSRDFSLGLPVKPRAPRHNKLRVKVPRTLVQPLERKQVREFLSTCERYRDLALVYLMLLCGLRSHEVLGLRLTDILFLESRILVKGKGGRERVMPLPLALRHCLLKYLELERPDGCL